MKDNGDSEVWDQGRRELSPEEAVEESRLMTEAYRQRVFVGVGYGEPISAAIEQAYQNAWDQAAAAGFRGPLKLIDLQIAGRNPPDWCRVVLGAGT